jgi:hypothetical protein
MANSFTKVTLGAAQTVGFTTPTYIVSSHLTVSVNNVTVPAIQAGATQKVFGSFTSTNPLYYLLVEGSTSLSFSEALPAGAVVLVNRNSSQSTKLVSYSDSGLLTSDVLNEDSNQAFFIAQEALDQSAGNFDSSFEASQGVTVTKVAGIEAGADVTDTANVVAALTAGTNITIASDGTITGTTVDTNTTYTGGTGLTLAGTTFNVDAAQTGITSLGTLSGLTTGATTVNGALTVNSDTLKLTSTTASSTVEHPSLELYRNGGAGSADLGAIKFFGNNNADPLEKFQYAGIYASVQSGADGSEQGSLAFSLGHGGSQEDPAMSLFSYGLQMGYGNPILMSYSNGYQQFFSPDAAQKSFKLNATPSATVANGIYDIYLPDVAGGTLAVINSDKAFTAGVTTVNGALNVNNTTQSITDTTTNSSSVYGPTIELYRNGGDGDAAVTGFLSQSDKLGTIDFYGNNDAGTPEKIKYAKIFSSIYEETDGAESGRLSFSVIKAGTHTEGANATTILDLEPDAAVFKQTVRIQATVNDSAIQATPTPILELFQSDGPEADDGDHLGEIQFTALNANGYSPAKHKYAGIHAEIIDESNATEDGSLHFTCIKAGVEDNTVLTLNGTESTFISPVKVAVGPITINSNNTNADLVITNSEVSSSDASPIIELDRSHGSTGHSDGDAIGKIEFYGVNSRGLSSGGPEKTLFGSLSVEVVDSSDGTEDGALKYSKIVGGAQQTGELVTLPLNGGVQFPAQSAAPSAPANGQAYYDTDDHKLKLYANGAWVDLN